MLVRCAYSAVAASTGGQQRRKLFLYSKEGCHLCDGLKEKIQALLDRAQFMPSPLSDISFEVRDITTEAAWWEAYSLTIPVLTVADPDGSNEVKVPRPSPRISTDRLGQHLEKALESREQET
ncbi:probable Glutaredoxin-like protein YDR286C [Coccomyxa sp. Obi]|nr:probable Glutaredoxin-like protein YDR286C [Coccomyxa sp. Obi]